MTPCANCGSEITPEKSLAIQGGHVCQHGCKPPVVEFHPGKGAQRYYLIDGEREANGLPIVSVTTILKEIGDKFGVAAWWGMTVGTAGTLELIQRGEPVAVELMTAEEVVPHLTKNKLTVNHVRDAAGDRGTSVHAAAEEWAASGEIPSPDDYPDTERGFVDALLNFLHIEQPEALGSEILVGSRKYAYAGTFDLDATNKRGRGLWDFKTKSKPPKGKAKAYEQHHLQLTAYETARLEMGMDPTDFQAVVNLYPNGEYAVIPNRASEDQWLRCLAAYRALAELKAEIKAAA